METPGTFEVHPDTPEHGTDTKLTETTPQLIYTSNEMVDNRIKADKHDQIQSLKRTLATVSVQKTEHSAAIHTQVDFDFFTTQK